MKFKNEDFKPKQMYRKTTICVTPSVFMGRLDFSYGRWNKSTQTYECVSFL